MPIIDDLMRAIDGFYYNIILSLAELHWSLQRGLILMGHTIETIHNWLVENAFAPLIEQTNTSLSVAVSASFLIALIVLGLTYLLSALIRLEVVDLRNAILWYIAGALFFSLGPSLYEGMNDFRTTISQGFYLSTLSGLQTTMGATFSSLDQVQSADLALGPLCDYLGAYLPNTPLGGGTVDGLDVALAYLRADDPDVMGFPPPGFSPGCPAHLFHPGNGDYVSGVPQDWFFEESYFDVRTSPIFFSDMDAGERAASLALASSSHARMLTSWPLIIFGVVEQLVYLLITIAMGITFLSFGMAILFAFFKKTEAIARSVVDQWIELIVQTVVIAMIQSLVVSFFLAGTAGGSGMVVLGVGLVCLIFMLILMWSGVKAVWNSINRLFDAIGQSTGGVVVSPGQMGQSALSAATLATGAALGVGSSALAGVSALRQGATPAQAAGLALGGSQTLSGAARTLAYLPGVRQTALGEAAEQFSEGSITREVAGNIPVFGRVAGPIVGAKLLTDRHPDHAEYDEEGRVVNRPMLVPAVGHNLARWTTPIGDRSTRRPTPPDYIEDEAGEMLPVATPRRSRMGTFTPLTLATPPPPTRDQAAEERRQDRSDYARELGGEELEQHISDTLRSTTGQTSPLGTKLDTQRDEQGTSLERAAAKLEASAQGMGQATSTQPMLGQLQVTGIPDVASIMGDVVAQAQATLSTSSNTTGQSALNYLQTGEHMAQVMGVQPQNNGASIQNDLTRFGLFLNQALRLGLSPQQTERVVREVHTSADGKLSRETRESLDKQVERDHNLPWLKARDEVDTLERTAQLLPPQITAVGVVDVSVQPTPPPNVTVNPSVQVSVDAPQPTTTNPDYEANMKKQSALGGSGNVLGGGDN